MANEPVITVVGNIGSEPELRFMPNGKAVVNFSLASTPRTKVGDEWKDGETTWFRCSAFEKMAENIAESLGKGQRIIAVGRMSTKGYEKNGEKKASLELALDSVGPDLRFAPVGGSSGGGFRASTSAPAGEFAAQSDSNMPAF